MSSGRYSGKLETQWKIQQKILYQENYFKLAKEMKRKKTMKELKINNTWAIKEEITLKPKVEQYFFNKKEYEVFIDKTYIKVKKVK